MKVDQLQMEFLCPSSQTSLIQNYLQGVQSGVVGAPSDIPRSPLPPVREHGTQVAVGSTKQESQPGLNVAELISSEAKALPNLLPLV